MTPDLYGNVKDGKLIMESRSVLDRWLLSLGECRVEVVVKKHRKKRTNPQNKYYWSVVCKIFGECVGYTPQEMHDALKWQFLQVPGELPTVKSTRKLTTVEFNEYIETVCRFAATERGIYIPPPSTEYDRWFADQVEKDLNNDTKS